MLRNFLVRWGLLVFLWGRALGETLAQTVRQPAFILLDGAQLAPDGTQALELARTRPWNYTTMNLLGRVRLARLAQHLDIDLWQYTLPDGRGLHAAVAWLKPYLLQEKQLDRPGVVPIGNQTALLLYDKASRHYPDLEAAKAFAQHPTAVRQPWAL